MKKARRVRTHTDAQNHIAELRNRRISQNAFDVVLRNRNRGGKESREATEQGNDNRGIRRQNRKETSGHVNTGSHHRRRVNQCTDGRGAFHRIRQPHMERELRRLADGAAEETKARNRQRGLRHSSRRHGVKNAGQVRRSRVHEEYHDPNEESRIANPVHDEGFLARIGCRILLVPETDQQVRTKADELPSHVNENETVGQDELQHREAEKRQKGEKAAVPDIALHVADTVEMHDGRDNRYHHQHHKAHVVEIDAHINPKRPELNPARTPMISQVGISTGQHAGDEEIGRNPQSGEDRREAHPIPSSGKPLSDKNLNRESDQRKK